LHKEVFRSEKIGILFLEKGKRQRSRGKTGASFIRGLLIKE
jgi:hypothetical protein